jgi:hypothetical protein
MNFKAAAEERFENNTREELAQFCDMLGVEYLPQNNEKTLRKKLLDALGQYHEVTHGGPKGESVTKLPDLPDKATLDAATLIGLNLHSQGGWQGKRRRISLHRALEYESTVFPHFFAWEGLHCYVPFGVTCDVPYPIWHVLQSANTGKKMQRNRKVDSEGRIYYEETWVPTQRFMVSDYGVTPGTEHLPEDVQDQVRKMWHLTDEFDGYSAAQFRQLCRMLKISVPADWRTPEMKHAIKRLLGLTTGAALAEPEGRTAKKVLGVE